MDRSSFVTVKSFNSLSEAEIYKSILDSVDIQCELWGSDSQILVSPMIEVALVVRDEDFEKAEGVLEGYFGD